MTKINSRTKGANGELEVAALLQAVVNEVALICGYVAPKIRRNVEQCQIGGEDLVGLPWYSFEVKRVEKVDLDKWWLQTCTQAKRKAAGSNAWDALVKGGWRKVAAGEAGTGQVGGGSIPSQEPDGVCTHVGGGSTASCEAAVPTGVGKIHVFPLPSWAKGGSVGRAGGFELNPRELLKAEEVELWEAISGYSTHVAELPPIKEVSLFARRLEEARQREAQANQDSSPVTGQSDLVATNKSPSNPNAEKQVPMAREPVLLWRVNKQLWQVRCVVDILCIDGTTKLRPTIDLSLDSWLEVLRRDLTYRLRG